MVKINKITLVTFCIFVAITILVIELPTYQINSLKANMANNPDLPSYKFEEAIQLWRLYEATAFQPASYILILVTIIIMIVFIAQTVHMNFAFKPKD